MSKICVNDSKVRTHFFSPPGPSTLTEADIFLVHGLVWEPVLAALYSHSILASLRDHALSNKVGVSLVVL